MARTPTIIPQEVKEQMCRDYRQGNCKRAAPKSAKIIYYRYLFLIVVRHNFYLSK